MFYQGSSGDLNNDEAGKREGNQKITVKNRKTKGPVMEPSGEGSGNNLQILKNGSQIPRVH